MTQVGQKSAEQIRKNNRVVYVHGLHIQFFFFFWVGELRKRLVFCSPTRVSFLGAEMQRKVAAFPESAATARFAQRNRTHHPLAYDKYWASLFITLTSRTA